MRGWVGVACVCLGILLGSCAPGERVADSSFCELPALEQVHSVTSTRTSLPTVYEITHSSANEIQATLYLDFQDLDTEAAKLLPLAPAMRKRTEECLKQANRYLHGPQGETLAFVLASVVETQASPLRQLIQVTARNLRGESGLWRSDWACPMILHEIVHKAGGLVDEYKETERDYGCRVEGPEDSLMGKDPDAAYRAVVGGTTDRTSLLYPAQFNAIAYPGCQARNALYYSCAQNAYRNRRDGCAKMQTECSAPGGDWVKH